MGRPETSQVVKLNRLACVYRLLPSSRQFFSPLPTEASGGDLTSLTHTHTLPPTLLTSSSCLISMQPGGWYSNSVLGCDLINGIWLPAWIPEMGLAFWNSDDGESGRRGSAKGRDVWRAVEESCQLGSGRNISSNTWGWVWSRSAADTEGEWWQEGYWRSTANWRGTPNYLRTNLVCVWLAGQPRHLHVIDLCYPGHLSRSTGEKLGRCQMTPSKNWATSHSTGSS